MKVRPRGSLVGSCLCLDRLSFFRNIAKTIVASFFPISTVSLFVVSGAIRPIRPSANEIFVKFLDDIVKADHSGSSWDIIRRKFGFFLKM